MSAFIDGSQIYGANRREADLLRDRTANLGLLRVASFPLSSAKSPLLPKAEGQTFCRSHNPTKKPCFLAGDHARVNENPGNVNFLLNEYRFSSWRALVLHVLRGVFIFPLALEYPCK